MLAGLVSGEREAIMSVFAWGWESRPRAFRPRAALFLVGP